MIFQRIQTYALNSIIKKIVTVLFLFVDLIMTGHAILTPLLMVIVVIADDFLSMSLTTDSVRPSPMPNAWRIGSLTHHAGGRLGDVGSQPRPKISLACGTSMSLAIQHVKSREATNKKNSF